MCVLRRYSEGIRQDEQKENSDLLAQEIHDGCSWTPSIARRRRSIFVSLAISGQVGMFIQSPICPVLKSYEIIRFLVRLKLNFEGSALDSTDEKIPNGILNRSHFDEICMFVHSEL